MGAFTVAFSAWALSSATSPSAGSEPLEPKAAPVATVEGESINATPRAVAVAGGFRLEGAPELEIVFGDVDRYKRHVDSFFGLGDKMNETRTRFSRHVQTALALLAATKAKRRCPYEELGPHYYAAHANGEDFRALGTGFEREYSAIRRLDQYGDTAALTPDYRWRINRARALYARSLSDYKELRFAFLNQLGGEVNARGCSRTKLLTIGKRAPRAVAAAATSPAKSARVPKAKKGELNARPLPATFYVDNRDCTHTMSVYVDGTLLGDVAAAARSAFQTTTGGHSLCLINADSVDQCGEPGTVRTAYFHDGWSIDLHCTE